MGSDTDSQSDMSEAMESVDSSSEEGGGAKPIRKVTGARRKVARPRKVQLAAC